MTIQKPCGIVYNLPHQGPPIYLPLHEVRVQALVVDVSAKVTLSQVFVNDSNVPTPCAKYVFPVPARAAVCAFEMQMEDGRVITGVAKEKQKAADEHRKAIRQGRVTSLMEWAKDDVFTISIGSLPAQQKVTTKLTYAIDLMNDDLTDQIRFQLPMSVGMRYGELPSTMTDASNPSPSTRVRIVIGIQTKGNIQSVVSPSHPKILALPFRSDDGEPSNNRIVATYDFPDFLTEDFVVNVQAEGLDEPRCFAEKDDKHGSVAMQLTLVPKFNLPPIASQEYIFLIDRSASMGCGRIETAKRTLVMLLRSLPASGTTFNIFSFGTRSSKLFQSSLEYTQDTLTSATSHVDSMSADYGGTEIRSALHNVFTSRQRTSPTAVFVLTDGETYDIDSTIKTVSDAVAGATAGAPLRVFTLGIGQTTSTAMCEGIARTGNGICLMATTSENILGKCAKLLRASRTFILRNVSVDWGVAPTLPQSDSVVLQAPSKIESIYPGCRLVISAMIKDGAFKIPEQVVLRGQRDGEGDAMEFKVSVQLVQPTQEDDTIPLVNTLAARRIITELEDPRNDSKHTEEQKKATIIRFGEEYQLASRYTSFVAVGDHVSEYQKEPKGKEEGEGSLSKFVGKFFEPSTVAEHVGKRRKLASVDYDDEDEEEDGGTDSYLGFRPMGMRPASYSGGGRLLMASGNSSGAYQMFGGDTQPAPLPVPGGYVGGGMDKIATPWVGALNRIPAPVLAPAPEHGPAPIFLPASAIPPLPPAAPPAPDSGVNPIPHRPTKKRLGASPGGMAPRKQLAAKSSAMGGHGVSHALAEQGTTPEALVVRLVRLQAFDGSFTLNAEFIQIVGQGAAEQGKVQGINDTIWATAVAVAYFRRHLANQPELLESLVEKAMDFVAESPLAQGVDFKALVEKAKGLV